MILAGPAVAVVGAVGAGIAAASDKGDCGEVCACCVVSVEMLHERTGGRGLCVDWVL